MIAHGGKPRCVGQQARRAGKEIAAKSRNLVLRVVARAYANVRAVRTGKVRVALMDVVHAHAVAVGGEREGRAIADGGAKACTF